VAHLATDPEVGRFNGHSLSSGELAKEYSFNDLDASQQDAWRYLVEVQDAGRHHRIPMNHAPAKAQRPRMLTRSFVLVFDASSGSSTSFYLLLAAIPLSVACTSATPSREG
jgi:hypothetical protein